MEDKITLGKFIQSKRKELGLSQKDLAKELYVTESAVSKWERGVSYPDITMISGLCRVRLFTRGLVCYGGAWNAPWGGYRIFAFCAEK